MTYDKRLLYLYAHQHLKPIFHDPELCTTWAQTSMIFEDGLLLARIVRDNESLSLNSWPVWSHSGPRKWGVCPNMEQFSLCNPRGMQPDIHTCPLCYDCDRNLPFKYSIVSEWAFL
jgi:hypothetical protein